MPEMERHKGNGCGMAKLKGIFNLILSSMRFAFITMR